MRVRAVGHRELRGRRDYLITSADEVPGRDCFPGRRLRWCGKGGHGSAALRRPQDLSLALRQVAGEMMDENALLQVQLTRTRRVRGGVEQFGGLHLDNHRAG